jgi:putative oxidoreductase
MRCRVWQIFFVALGDFMKFLNSLQPFALLILRIALGIIFLTHGYPKLMKSAAPMQAMFIQHGLPGYFVYVAGVLEVFGGGMLILGLFARAAGFLLAMEMAVAIVKVHSAGGILAVHNYEFPLSLAVACLALAAVGPGLISIDAALFERGSSSRSRTLKSPRN